MQKDKPVILKEIEGVPNKFSIVISAADEDMTGDQVERLLPFIYDGYNFIAVRGYGEDFENLTGVDKQEFIELEMAKDPHYSFQIWPV